MTGRRTLCPECGQDVSINPYGTLRRHVDRRKRELGRFPRGLCRASGKPLSVLEREQEVHTPKA